MALLRSRMSEEELEALFNTLGSLLKKYLAEEEYHEHFLKEEDDPP